MGLGFIFAPSDLMEVGPLAFANIEVRGGASIAGRGPGLVTRELYVVAAGVVLENSYHRALLPGDGSQGLHNSSIGFYVVASSIDALDASMSAP